MNNERNSMKSLGRFQDQVVWHCSNMGTRINFNSDCISLCHEAQVGDRILMPVKELTPESYYGAIYEIMESVNNDDNFVCRLCSKCERRAFRQQKINYVTICTSMFCNSKCIYCTAHFGSKDSGYDPVPYLQMFHEQHLFCSECYFDWGGGEPTLNPYYESTVNWLYQHGYRQRFNTNAIVFSEMTFQALKEGKGNVRISVDSGTKETYRVVKGTNSHDVVWKNINRYCSASGEVYIKYNIFNYNSKKKEIESFVEQCCRNNVRHILIDGEITSYQPSKNAGPFYFTEEELQAAKYLQALAESNGLEISVSEYAFSVRPEYEPNGRLKLPLLYYNNVDTSVISNGIKVRTFATVGQLLERIKSLAKIPVVVWGDQVSSKTICEVLRQEGVRVRYLIDDNFQVVTPEKEASKLERFFSSFMGRLKSENNHKDPFDGPADGVTDITTFEKVSKSLTRVHLLIAGAGWKEKLQLINHKKYMIDGFVYYMPDVYFYKHERLNSIVEGK